MDSTTPAQKTLLVCQYWVTIIRLLDALYVFGFMEYQLSQTYPKVEIELGPVGLLSSQLALWTILMFNDCFILTIDFQRTDYYLGCIATQAVISTITTILTFTALGLYIDQFGWEPIIFGGSPRYGVGPYMFGIPLALGALCSLCLLAISVWPLFIHQSHLSLVWLWKCNTKDAFIHNAAQLKQPREIRMFGHSRDPPISVLYVPNLTGRSFVRLISPIFFRRVSPVETRGYAFVRNSFAAFFVAIIIFRTVTALLQAQNKIETRMKSRDCREHGYKSDPHDIQVLAEYDYEVANITVFFENTLNATLAPCTPVLPRSTGSSWIRQIFSCNVPPSLLPVFRVEIRSPSGSVLTEAGMPRIWLSNKNEGGRGVSFDQYDKRTARVYSPVWRLRPGFHIEAEAKLITRRFIKSSAFRDIILYFDPAYTQRSLYPIVENSRSALTGNTGLINATQATSTIRATLNPGFDNYYRSQEDFWNLQRGLYDFAKICDYIEDYRSGTILDVLGSVGGLFALLHAAHVLLFGRPLLWGLTGAKLITPFGWLGIFSSTDFKRRLQEHYHRQPTQDDPEPFRVGAFLRDFVIDLGPADTRPSREPGPELSITEGYRDDSISSRIPLVRVQSSGIPARGSGGNNDFNQFSLDAHYN